MLQQTKEKIELLPHNQALYDDIVAKIEDGERSIFYSEATGLGKSFIFMRLVQDYFTGKKILYIVPKIAIWENLTKYKEFKYLDAQIEMTTFTAFNKYDEELHEKYDTVFIDECHHMLSDIQGGNVLKFCIDMVSEGKFAFGLTATPYYQGEYVDEKCFGVSCYGLDVFEAIECGLLPKVKLALANIDLNALPKDVRARFSITGTKPLIERLIEEHSEINKWLAYYLNKQELEENVEELQTLFPDYKILKVYEGIGNEADVFKEFEESTEKVILMSVNKLLEGVHLIGVEGVLLYRNVIEFSTYMQMYGRLCNINSKSSPVFLDVTNAIISINKVKGNKSSRFTGQRVNYAKKDLFDVTASDYWTIELADFLQQPKKTWKYNLSSDQISFIDEVIIQNPEATANAIQSLIGFDIPCNYISKRRSELGLSKREFYSSKFLQKFKEAYETGGIAKVRELEECKDMSRQKIRSIVARYKYKSGKTKISLTKAETELIDKYLYTDTTIKPTVLQFNTLLPTHSKNFLARAIQKRAAEIGLEYLKHEYFCNSCKKASYLCICRNHPSGFTVKELCEWNIPPKISYKGFFCNNIIDLAKITGVPYDKLRYRSFVLKYNEHELIDWIIATMPEVAAKFGHNSDNNNSEIKYRGVNINQSQKKLSLELGLNEDYISRLKALKKLQTIEEIIDEIFIKFPKLRLKYEPGKTDELYYKGIPIYSTFEASKALGYSRNNVDRIMKQKKWTIQETLDYLIEKKNKQTLYYKNIPICSACAASVALGKEKNYIGKLLRKYPLWTIQQAIDYTLEKIEQEKKSENIP